MKYFNFKDMNKKASYILRLCRYYFRLEVFYFRVNIIAICAYSFFGMFNLAAVFPLVSAALSNKDLKSGGVIIDNIVKFASRLSPFPDFFITMVFFASILMIATAGLGILNDIYTGRLVQGINKRVKIEVFKKYLYSDYQFFLDSEHGDLLFKLLTATTNSGAFFLNLMNLAVEILKSILLFVLLLTLSLKATLAMVIVGAVFFGIICILSRKVSYVIGNAILNVNSRQNIIANEALKGIKHIKVSRAIGLWIRKFAAKTEEYYLLKMRNIIFRSLPFRLLEIIAFLLIISAAIFNRFSSGKNLIDMLPFLSIYGLAIIRVIPSLTAIGDMVMGIAGSFPDVRAVYDILHRTTHSRQDGALSIGEINDGITFKDVTFGYPGKKPLFESLNFFIPKNKITAIVGESGSGKTSIINLLLKIFEPVKGEIMFGSYRLGDISCDSLYKKVSVVSQDTFIFNDTIKNNIDFGLDRPLDEIINASSRAGMHNFIMGLPQGYDTFIGDDGLKLSGGQRQRIAIARALLRDFEILILDEATASLDSKSERVIQDTINAISLNKTVIIIAHRLSTVANADSILVLNKGQVVEKGRHEELLKNEGTYYRLYHRHLDEIFNKG